VGMIKVRSEDLESVSRRLSSGSQAIEQQLSDLRRAVDQLANQGWEGAASSQFHELYGKWSSGAGEVQQALNGISELLSRAAQAYAQTEQQIRDTMRG
jgi:WXG100 family type VII secretion target